MATSLPMGKLAQSEHFCCHPLGRPNKFAAVLVVGLTGSLGAGKSTVGRALELRGAVVIDADQVARDVLAPGTQGERAVLARWGEPVSTPDGHLDRRALGRLVFASAPDRLELEALTHPLIWEEVAKRMAAAQDAGALLVVVELPLLDESRRRQYGMDLVVLVDVPLEVAVARAATRGIPEAEVRARIAVQPSAEARRALADRVIVNASTKEDLDLRVNELWEWLGQRARSGEQR